MDLELIKRNKKRKKRALRNHKRVRGSSARPRLSVFKSNSHIGAQIIDDENQCTLVSFSTLSKEVKGTENAKKSMSSAQFVGEKLGTLAKEKEITTVVFDRGRFKYHGLLKELADGARKAGLQF
ncbi:MAG: 50S ribosomal protein L18 [Candidatus Algichlamydia australiensis]|nr:50S ribosomal protein L18 [Chlamydiales bacterium]